ncbi:TonB-dependent receptor plug domain-containing protein [Horticoccus sp. 23ND18S-11]|uniref:TonB-dependent receptor plug domain-containing protein n=1 Tax=Horticoccus sp. 23ND18S-11 TaxID=3391832 RepID=UPI0039C93B30
MRLSPADCVGLACALVTALGLASGALSAQTAPLTPVTPMTPASASPVVELSPFTVNTSKDLGYTAENTLAGSRLNARLRDTAGSVSVFTKEFLDDLAITDIAQLLDYTVNSEMDTNAWQAGSGQNPSITGENLLNRTIIRGLAASQGMDYFMAITNGDPYRVGRFDDTRGPNSILFGIGAPGGLLNQSSKVARTHGNSASIRYGFGSWERSRIELDANRVLLKDKLALSIAALDQENGGWRQFDFQDKERIFGAITFRPHRSLTLQAMGETGRDASAVMKTMPPSDEVLAWYDNRTARGVDAVTVAPTTAAPTAALVALGITARNGTSGGQNRRATFVENNGTIFDAIGTYLTGTYNNAAVRAPDGTRGVTGSGLVLNDPAFYPRWANAGGPGMSRQQKLYNYTLSADWQPTRNWVFNAAHHYQQTTLTSRILVGTDPTLRGDPNRTLGLNGPANPFAGRLYFDGNWRGDIHYGDFRESRLAGTYTLDTKSRWWGRHRLAGAASRSQQVDDHALSWLSLVGRPFNAQVSNANNRIAVRNYVTEGDYGTYRVGDWRSVPSKFTFGGRTFDLAFANDVAGANNSGMAQGMDSLLGVVQSYLLRDRLVTTVGYRRDDVKITQFGYYDDPIMGDSTDRDPAKATVTKLKASTWSVGGVWHLTDWFSLIANTSSNVGVPPLARTVFPLGNLAPLSKGKGRDYGIGLDLLEGRLSARFVYFTAEEQGRITSAGLGGAPARNSRVMEAYAGVLVGPGRTYSTSEWAPILKASTPPANAIASDFTSEGYEARITANLTSNWRLVANYSYTDSGRTNLATELIDWYGLKAADGVRLVQGVKQDTSGRFVVDPAAFAANGTVAKWIELGGKAPAANPSTLVTDSAGTTVAQEIFNLVDTLNDEKELQEKRWGVRPHKISLFTAYDFKTGRLKGITIGGGWRWRSANVIGSDAQGREITGREIAAADFMLGYSWKFERLPGRFRVQMNVSNLLDQTDIIPVRLSTSDTAPDGFVLPGGRGVAYSRYDLVPPREVRFTTTYSF